MNKGTMVLVGCVVGAGVLFYTTTGGSAARPTATPSPTAAAHGSPEVAHSGKTPKPAEHETTPATTVSPTQARLTLAQVRNLPRPFVPPAVTGGGFQPPAPPSSSEPPVAPATPTPTPAAATPLPATPPSEEPPPATPTQPPHVPTATPTATFPWWDIPTPPPLPPHPDAGVAPNPPSE